jgi:NTP pyrophosphatase (non-canonical NTP hydrolase)
MKHSDIEPLQILQEECAEVIQVIAKGFRFGFDEPYDMKTNRQKLTQEVGDVLCMVDILVKRGFIDQSEIETAKRFKKEQLKRWSNIIIDEE